ncbi:uncharacterized protein N7482_008485 [Penicillium canariense]|uniref:Mannosyl phosphorylinositol ceramide synthase SUR1 n=1 Tax=Penicillium canariense TaxID=189055 RepID=A0A9W9HW30_9EURO|nr:uncharacterized protein N7482_008485 [Penicillium canariense]KAJ5157385.1 hypothetical protein N7482_008485 [Penicillium canariense]
MFQYGTNADKPYDEERLSWGAEHSLEQRRKSMRIRWPRKSTILLSFLDVFVIWLLIRQLEPLLTLLRRNEELFKPQVSLSGKEHLSNLHEMNGSSRIPRILHQTTATNKIPDKWVEPQASCKEAYGDFEYKLWTDESTRAFLSIHYPWFVDIWDNYAFPIQRADSLRYFILYHYGGIYLDMDTWCNRSIPIDKLELDAVSEYALFKSTVPTGVTNDFMITSARHPVYAAAIAKLPISNSLTRAWAQWQPYCAIMMSAGPMFLTMVAMDYLLKQASLPSQNIGVVNQTELTPYITDLESGSWHRADTKVLMWLGSRPWTWFIMGAMGLFIFLYVLNRVLMITFEFLLGKVPHGIGNLRLLKGPWKIKI